MTEKDCFEKIKELAYLAGKKMREADRSEMTTDAKTGHQNFVTKYDKAIEQYLREELKKIFPEAAFFGEETANGDFPDTEYVFVVDPIDGTSNFIKDLRWSCVAIALTKQKERICGMVYNPYTEELFSAVKGEGAFLNDVPIRVSPEPLERGIAVFGTAPYYDDIRGLAMKKAVTSAGPVRQSWISVSWLRAARSFISSPGSSPGILPRAPSSSKKREAESAAGTERLSMSRRLRTAWPAAAE